jgi:YD repeat-containing protein
MSARRHSPGGIAAVVAFGAACAILAGASTAWALEGPAPGAVTANTVKLPDGPASVHGLGDKVSTNLFTAQVGYSVPIELPTGVGGFGPHLAVTYSGELGNGPVGIGWSLPTIEIRRSVRHGVPAYDDTDELELTGLGGGGRLIPNTAVAGEYFLEGNGVRFRIVRHETSFEITDSEGTHYFLGQTAAGRLENGSHVAAWFLEWAVNVVAQEMRFSYKHETGEVYLDSITWGPTVSGAPAYSVDLTYEDRSDVVTSYRTGFVVQTGSRLKQLDVTSFKQPLRQYVLTYDPQFVLSRLRSVTETQGFGHAALTDVIPPVTFTYAQPEAPNVVSVPGFGGWVLNQRGVSLADVDGDGTADLLRLELGNHTYRQNHGGVFLGEKPLHGAEDVPLESAGLIDLDGDSRPELVRVVDDTWRAYRLIGDTWTSMGEWPGTRNVPLHDPNWVLADVNGDGRTDAIQARTGGISVRFNGIAGMGPPTSLPFISTGNVEVAPGASNTRFLDMNGDGLVDVVWLTDTWMKIFLGKGDGTFVPFDRVTYPWRDASVALTDIQLADLNRDGLIDLIRTTSAQVQWFAGLPSLHFAPTPRSVERPEGASSDAVVTIADANGNGSHDVVWSSARGLWILDLAGTTSAGMLTVINNGMGQVTTIGYASSAELSAAADKSGAPWDHKLPIAIPVPTRVEIDSGGGVPPVVSEHSVRDGFWDGVERRFGGFLQSLTRELGPTKATTLVEEQRYHAGLGSDRVLRGKTWWTKRSSDDGYLFDVKQTTWTAFLVDAAKNVTDPPWITELRALPQPGAQIPSGVDLLRIGGPQTEDGLVYEGQVTPVETRVDYQYDEFARPFQEKHLGVVNAPGDEKIITRHYVDPDDSTWIRDKVDDETISEIDGITLRSETQTYYGPPSGAYSPFGQVSLGLVRRVDGRLNTDAGPRFVTQSTTDYDACGSPAVVYADGVTRSLTYTDCLFAHTETVSSDVGQQLTWKIEWDEPKGVPHTLTDPNNIVTDVEYDEMERPKSVQVLPNSPHIYYTYDWGHPLPTTATSVFDRGWSDLPASLTGPGWRTTTVVANGGGQSLYSTVAVGDGRTIVSGWKVYDERGHVELAAEPFYAAQLPPTAPPAGTREQTFDYDAISRIVHQTLPNGAIKTTGFSVDASTNALFQVVQSPELADVRSDLDGLGRVVRTQRSLAQGLESVVATYDAADRIRTMSLQDGAAIHTFIYDTLGRLTSGSDPDTGDRTLQYYDENFLKDHINGAGQDVSFVYDLAGRLKDRREGTADAAIDYTYTYDDDTKAAGPGCNVQGRLAQVIEPTGVPGMNGEVHLCYDVLGRSIKLARTIVAAAGSRSATMETTLSPSGLTLGELFDDGFATTYTYDGAGRATSVTSGGAQLWHATDMDASGRLAGETYGNGATEAYTYDDLGLTQSVDLRSTVGGVGTDLFNIVVTSRTKYGAPKTVEDHDGQGLDHAATYTYDDAARLTGATLGASTDPGGQYAFSFKYDGLQNMIDRRVTQNGVAKDIGVLAGVYKYGERGYGPRQLTSVVP